MLHTPPMSSMSSLDGDDRSPITPTAEYYDEEPDEEWKENRRQIIHNGFQDMIHDAKQRLERNLQSLRGMEDLDEEERERDRLFFVDEFQTESQAIKALAKEEFEHALARERLRRRLKRDDLPIRPIAHSSPLINHQSLRLDLEQEQAATLKAATSEEVEAAFQSLIHPSSDDHPPPSPDLETDADLKGKEHAQYMEVAHISPGAGALTIKITPLPAEPPLSGDVGWVKASDAARKHAQAMRQRASSAAEAAQITGPPPPPPKKWVSASDAARRTSYRRIESHGS
ncbi:hypothetical protein MSAN_01411000 [Mycena sanguinolenta]|uniref:Uncharacterized protein n=1 Tax=Mycena sanguinolenta TaxID=230812 RepID=A0A8H6Y9L3_9AGAR|nr:hypothetical protein MSAN_01411000 [Mycena sanguinolenta]